MSDHQSSVVPPCGIERVRLAQSWAAPLRHVAKQNGDYGPLKNETPGLDAHDLITIAALLEALTEDAK
jgi:hypothetical protein